MTSAIALGFWLEASLRWPRLSLGIAAHADLPAGTTLPQGAFTTSLLTGSFVPCVRRSIFGACVVASIGVMRAAGAGLPNEQRATLFYSSLGGRLTTEIPLPASFTLVFHIGAGVPLVRSSLLVGGTAVWVTPPVHGNIGAAFGYIF